MFKGSLIPYSHNPSLEIEKNKKVSYYLERFYLNKSINVYNIMITKLSLIKRYFH